MQSIQADSKKSSIILYTHSYVIINGIYVLYKKHGAMFLTHSRQFSGFQSYLIPIQSNRLYTFVAFSGIENISFYLCTFNLFSVLYTVFSCLILQKVWLQMILPQTLAICWEEKETGECFYVLSSYKFHTIALWYYNKPFFIIRSFA